MVEIELDPSAKTKIHFSNIKNKIGNIISPNYKIVGTHSNVINERLFMHIDYISHVTKKKWFSKKTHDVMRTKRVCWMCYQDAYGIYIYPSQIKESIELANLLEKSGYTVRIIVENEKCLTEAQTF